MIPWTVQSMEFSSPGVGSLSLLQGIFPTQGSNPGLPHCRQILYQLSHQGSPGILEWLAHLFSSGSSRPRNQTGVSCIIGGFFTNGAIREAQCMVFILFNLLRYILWARMWCALVNVPCDLEKNSAIVGWSLYIATISFWLMVF